MSRVLRTVRSLVLAALQFLFMSLAPDDCKEVLKKIMTQLMNATADKKTAPPVMLAIDRACTYVHALGSLMHLVWGRARSRRRRVRVLSIIQSLRVFVFVCVRRRYREKERKKER